jgi:chemotaxis protein methyltransferase CheR
MQMATLTQDAFARFAAMVHDRAGIHLPEEKRSLLSNRLRARLRALNLDTFETYYDRFGDPTFAEEELPYFLSAVTTNETYFFRNEKLWEMFETQLLPEFIETHKSRTKSVKVWSAAASSGEEAYTCAICLLEGLPEGQNWRPQVVGTDISRRVLDRAGQALYNDYAVSKMTPQRRSRWFTKTAEGYQLQEAARKIVRFQFHNLRDSFQSGIFDLVLLRNVLMYFDTEMKQRTIQVAQEAVAPGGYLFIGDVDPTRTSKELMSIMAMEPLTPGLYHKPRRKVFGQKSE